LGSLSCQLACSNQLQCRIKHDSETATYYFDKFSVFKKKKVGTFRPNFWLLYVTTCHILECVLSFTCDETKYFFFFAILFIGSYGHCGIANNLMLGRDRWRILILLRKFFFDFNAFKFDLWFYDWIWGHSTASNQLQL